MLLSKDIFPRQLLQEQFNVRIRNSLASSEKLLFVCILTHQQTDNRPKVSWILLIWIFGHSWNQVKYLVIIKGLQWGESVHTFKFLFYLTLNCFIILYDFFFEKSIQEAHFQHIVSRDWNLFQTRNE
jgi:hypothetical protein